MSEGDNPRAENRSATDSPWLWIGVFLFGALITLMLMAPKFQRRQLQLERQYEARQAAGQSVPDEDSREATRSGQLIITLTPLFYFLVVLVLLMTILFWCSRIRQRLRRGAMSGSDS